MYASRWRTSCPTLLVFCLRLVLYELALVLYLAFVFRVLLSCFFFSWSLLYPFLMFSFLLSLFALSPGLLVSWAPGLLVSWSPRLLVSRSPVSLPHVSFESWPLVLAPLRFLFINLLSASLSKWANMQEIQKEISSQLLKSFLIRVYVFM